MGRAVLVYTIDLEKNPKSVTLESGSLSYIDCCTKRYNGSLDLEQSFEYKDKIRSLGERGTIKAYYIQSNSLKEEIPILYSDNKPIIKYDNYYDKQLSESEISRKLLFNSKNKLFIKSFLKSSKLTKSLNFDVKLSYNEYLYALKKDLKATLSVGEYKVSAKELFMFASNNSKLGILRGPFEDSLDKWKRKFLSMDEEELYYHSRNLRILINDYNSKIKNRISIKNLRLYHSLYELTSSSKQTHEILNRSNGKNVMDVKIKKMKEENVA